MTAGSWLRRSSWALTSPSTSSPNWEKYLAPSFLNLSPLNAAATMRAVGVVEIVAALVVALRPRIGAYVVAAWLAGIILNLLLVGGYYDVALRDFGLVLGALALGRLSATYDRSEAARGHEESASGVRPMAGRRFVLATPATSVRFSWRRDEAPIVRRLVRSNAW